MPIILFLDNSYMPLIASGFANLNFLKTKYLKNLLSIILAFQLLYLCVPYDYVTRKLGTHQVSREAKRIERNEMSLNCMRKSWSVRPDTHPGAPIHSMSKGIPDQFLNFHFLLWNHYKRLMVAEFFE